MHNHMNDDPDIADSNSEEFIRLLTTHERQLGRYAMTMVPHVQDCDEVLQESRLVMWRSFDRFERGTDFVAWGRRVIFNQVLKYRRRPSRRNFPFSEETLQLLLAENEACETELDHRVEWLQGCLKKLPGDHQRLLQFRYHDELPIEKIAEQVERTTGAIYRLLSRIRRTLFDCVNNRNAEGSLS